MRTKQIRESSKADQEKKLSELKSELMKDRTQISAGTPPKNPGLMKQRRRIIARIKTVQREQA